MKKEEESKWYILHTYSGYENKVVSSIEKAIKARSLKNVISEFFIPTEIVSEIKDNKKKDVERKLFPGYVLVKMVLTNDIWYIIRGIRGCSGFVGTSSKPTPLDPEEVKKFGVSPKKTVKVFYDVGDSVQITDGPLEDFSGIVAELDKDNDYVRVTVSMFGRDTPVELKLNQVQTID